LDLSALKTLISVNKVPSNTPSFLINEKTYSGYMNNEEFEKIIKPLLPTPAATSTKIKQ
jgi:hypothetical protein